LAPDVILVYSTAAAKELQRQTGQIPIVFVQASDPVGNGLAVSLAHPGANITGLTNFEFLIGSKWVPMLKQIAPSISRLAVLFNPKTAARGGMVWVNPIDEAAATLGIRTIPMPAYDAAEIERLVDAFAREANGGLIAAPDAFTSGNYATIVATAAKNRLPALYPFRFFVESGGLMSYGPDEDAMFEQTAYYVDRILRGEKPSDLPIQAPARLDLVINLKTVKTLGLDVPPNLLALTSDVIE
jgi:putative ABC transport system substrate-binding protein